MIHQAIDDAVNSCPALVLALLAVLVLFLHLVARASIPTKGQGHEGERTMSCRAFSPRTVTDVEIFSLRLMEKVRTVYRAFPNTGCCPVSCSKTCGTKPGLLLTLASF